MRHRVRGRVRGACSARLVATIGAAVVAAACGSSGTGTTSTSATGSQSSRVAVVRLQGPGTLNNIGYPTPFASNRGPGKLLTSFVFDQLVWPDSSGTMKPWLARSWTSSADGKTWTFTVRNDAVWQDGTPLTAADVVFSFTYVMPGGPGNGVAPATNAIATVTSPSADTVVLQLKRPDPTLLDEIGGFGGVFIIPQHIWSAVTDPVHFQGAQALIGSGPYKLTTFDLSQGSYEYAANDKFFLGPPVVQSVRLVALPANANPLLYLQRGEIDAASAPNSSGGVPQSEIDSLKGRFTMLTARGEYNVALHVNLAKGFPYSSQQFRQAIAYAVNRNDILKRVVGGRGVPGSPGGLGPGNPWLDANLPAYTFDLAKAKSLLDGIGLKDTDGDGIRNLPGGGDVHLPLTVSSTDVTEAQLVREYLLAAGLQVDITSVDQASMDTAATQGKYDLAVVHYGGLSADPYTRICSNYASTGGKTSFSFTHAQGYDNPTVNTLCSQIAVTVDHATRQQLVDQLQSAINADVPILPLYVPDQITFVNAKVFKAFAYTPGCPPCGAAENKLMLATGKTSAPAPSAASS